MSGNVPSTRRAAAGSAARAGCVPSLRLALALLAAVALSIHLMGDLMAKFASADSASEGARAAAFSFMLADADGSHAVDLAGIEKPGDSRTYRFAVASGSETSLRYWLAVELDGSMPVELDVKDASGTTVIASSASDLDAALRSGKPLVKWSEPDGIAPNGPAREYTLTASWPAGNNDMSYAGDSVGELVVRARCEQVD